MPYEKEILQAAKDGNVEEIKKFLAIGADIEAVGEMKKTPLHFAIQSGSLEAVRILLDSGANLKAKDGWGNNCLHIAAFFGRLDIAKFLVAQGAHILINEKDQAKDHGNTPLHIATQHGFFDFVSFLLGKKADTEIKNDGGCTPIFHAHTKDQIGLFVAHGAKLNVVDRDGYSPLHRAVERERDIGKGWTNEQLEEEVLSLLAFGADINIRVDGTPLHTAAYGCFPIAARLLVECGADRNIRNGENKQPATFALDPTQPSKQAKEEVARIINMTVVNLSRLEAAKQQAQIFLNILQYIASSGETPAMDLPDSKEFDDVKEAFIKNLMSAFKNLIFQGGGVKGLAYIGALKMLVEKMKELFITLNQFKRTGGASAGGLTALFFALGNDFDALSNIVGNLDLKTLLDDEKTKKSGFSKREAIIKLEKLLSDETLNGIDVLVYLIYHYVKSMGVDLLKELAKKSISQVLDDLKQAQLFNTVRNISFVLYGLLALMVNTPIIVTLKVMLPNLINDVLQKVGANVLPDIEKRLLPLFNDNPAELSKFTSAVSETLEDAITDVGIFSGNAVTSWIKEQIEASGFDPDITFQGLKDKQQTNSAIKDLYIAVVDLTTGLTKIYSHQHTPNAKLWFAGRATMSIPYLFVPPIDDNGHVLTDGGVNDNCPDWIFDKPEFVNGDTAAGQADVFEYNPETLCLKLVSDESKELFENDVMPDVTGGTAVTFVNYSAALASAFLKKQDSDHYHTGNRNRTIYIATGPVNTVDFDLSAWKKNLLINFGESGVLDFLNRIDPGWKFNMPQSEQVACALPRVLDHELKHKNSHQTTNHQIQLNSAAIGEKQVTASLSYVTYKHILLVNSKTPNSFSLDIGQALAGTEALHTMRLYSIVEDSGLLLLQGNLSKIGDIAPFVSNVPFIAIMDIAKKQLVFQKMIDGPVSFFGVLNNRLVTLGLNKKVECYDSQGFEHIMSVSEKLFAVTNDGNGDVLKDPRKVLSFLIKRTKPEPIPAIAAIATSDVPVPNKQVSSELTKKSQWKFFRITEDVSGSKNFSTKNYTLTWNSTKTGLKGGRGVSYVTYSHMLQIVDKKQRVCSINIGATIGRQKTMCDMRIYSVCESKGFIFMRGLINTLVPSLQRYYFVAVVDPEKQQVVFHKQVQPEEYVEFFKAIDNNTILLGFKNHIEACNVSNPQLSKTYNSSDFSFGKSDSQELLIDSRKLLI